MVFMQCGDAWANNCVVYDAISVIKNADVELEGCRANPNTIKK